MKYATVVIFACLATPVSAGTFNDAWKAIMEDIFFQESIEARAAKKLKPISVWGEVDEFTATVPRKRGYQRCTEHKWCTTSCRKAKRGSKQAQWCKQQRG